MIVFDLICEHDHVFEAWFASGEAFETQRAREMISCPLCESSQVSKAVMAPAVAAKSNRCDAGERKKELARLAGMQAEVEARCDYVGRAFASEARARHRAPADSDAELPRGIVGEASIAEARELIEDGIPVAPLPFRSRRAADA